MVTKDTLVADAVGHFNWDFHSRHLSAFIDDFLLDGDEARVLCDQTELKAQRDDSLLQVLTRTARLHARPVLRHQVIHLGARPQGCEHITADCALRRLGRGRGGQLDLNLPLERSRGGLAAHGDGARAALRVAALQHKRFCREQVGDQLRIGEYLFDVEPAEIDADIGQHGTVNAFVEALRRGVAVRFKRDNLRLPAALARHTLDQELIDAVADAEGEHARRGRVLTDFIEDSHVVADETVGHETYDAHTFGIARAAERRLDRAHHFRAAAALQSFQVLERARTIFRGVRYRLVEAVPDTARERHQVERIVRVHLLDAQPHGLLGFLDRESPHRAAAVDDKAHLFRRGLFRRDALRRVQHHCHEPATIVHVRKYRVGNLFLGYGILEHEIAVRDFLLVLQRHHCLFRCWPVDGDLVQHRFQRLHRHARVQRNGERNVMTRARTLRRYGRRDVLRVRHLVGACA